MYRNELFYRSLFAESLDGVLLVNPEGIIGFVSPSIRNILGYDPDEISGRNVFEFVHPEDSEWAIASFKREVMENPEIKFIVVRVSKKSGEWLWCMVRGHNLLKNPNVNSIVIYLHDDTLRKKAIEALKESEQRFRKLVQDLQFGVVMQDNQGRVIMCNNALLDILHLNEQELIGKTIAETLDEVILENGKAATENDMPLYIASRTKKTAKNSVIGIKSLRFSNRKWLLVSSSPILDEHEEVKHVICTITDITERKNLEQTLLHKKIEHQKHVT
ncbi:MAG TPA: PAS domain-containing protein, partial [Chitinophagaceae bacterium]